jgi:hypothetical protein
MAEGAVIGVVRSEPYEEHPKSGAATRLPWWHHRSSSTRVARAGSSPRLLTSPQ